MARPLGLPRIFCKECHPFPHHSRVETLFLKLTTIKHMVFDNFSKHFLKCCLFHRFAFVITCPLSINNLARSLDNIYKNIRVLK